MILKYFKIISDISFIFLIVNFFLCLTGYTAVSQYIFLWMILLGIVLYSYKTRFAVLLMLPVIFINSNMDKVVIMLIFAVIFYIYKLNSNKLSYEETSEKFKKAFLIIIGIVIISGMNLNSIITNKYIIPYTIFYLIFTVMLLRYLRNYEFNAVNEKLNKINTVYFISIIISAVIFALESVRNFIIIIFLFIYRNIMSVFIYISSIIILFISNLFKNIHIKVLNSKIINLDTNKSKFDDTDYAVKDFALLHPLLYKIITIIFNVLLIALVIYIIFRILNKKATSSTKSEECEETKEFIFSRKHSNKLKRPFIFGDYSSQIKYYYGKLMKDSVSKGVNLEKSDTTMDISLKSKEVFNKKSLWGMRDYYIEIRYGDSICTKDMLKKFISFYKNRKL
jgi:hypothetical protein